MKLCFLCEGGMALFDLENIVNKYGQTVTLIKGDHITGHIKEYGAYDHENLCLIEKILLPYRHVVSVDVGANIGNHTLLFSRISEKVYSFEPIPELFDILKKNIIQNDIKNVECINVGLSNENVDSAICVETSGNVGKSSLEYTFDGGVRKNVSLVKGDGIFATLGIARIDFLKIDVEGHEAKVIEGMKESLLKFRPIVHMEWDHHKDDYAQWEKDIFRKYFPEYSIFSFSNFFNKSLWKKKFLGTKRRRFAKGIGVKDYLGLVKFDPLKSDSCNIMLFPNEKIENIPKKVIL